MGASVLKFNATGNGVLTLNAPVPSGSSYRLVSVTCVFSVGPVTSEQFSVTVDANAGPVYDYLVYSVDPSVGIITDILWQPEAEILLEGGDVVTVGYPNTDARLYGTQITFKAV
jgi:hypothetical protein